MTGRLAGLICSKNDPKCRLAIDALAGHVDKLLCVDSSTDPEIIRATVKAVEAWDGKAEYLLRPAANLSEAKNIGINRLRGYDYIAIVDADMRVAPDWGRAARRAIEGSPDIVVGARRQCDSTSFDAAFERQHNDDFRNFKTFIALPQDNTIWSMKVFDTIGLFDERFVRSGEDMEISFRALDAGFNPLFDMELMALHDHDHLNSILKILKRRFDYMVGGAMANLLHGTLGSRIGRRKVYHPLQLLDYPMMALAVPIAKMRLTR